MITDVKLMMMMTVIMMIMAMMMMMITIMRNKEKEEAGGREMKKNITRLLLPFLPHFISSLLSNIVFLSHALFHCIF